MFILSPPPGMAIVLRGVSYLPELDQVIHAAGVSSIIASVVIVVYMLIRFVRGQMNQVPWHSATYADMTRRIPHTKAADGWTMLKAEARPKPVPNVPTMKNVVFSDSEDVSDWFAKRILFIFRKEICGFIFCLLNKIHKSHFAFLFVARIEGLADGDEGGTK